MPGCLPKAGSVTHPSFYIWYCTVPGRLPKAGSVTHPSLISGSVQCLAVCQKPGEWPTLVYGWVAWGSCVWAVALCRQAEGRGHTGKAPGWVKPPANIHTLYIHMYRTYVYLRLIFQSLGLYFRFLSLEYTVNDSCTLYVHVFISVYNMVEAVFFPSTQKYGKK